MIELTSEQCRALRAAAHHLHPVVTVAGKGLTPTVLQEIERSLAAHELIKVKLAGIERAEREALLAEIAGQLNCAPVQHIGNTLVLWRPKPESDETTSARKPRTAKPKTKKQAAAVIESRRRAAPRRDAAPAKPVSARKSNRRSP